MYWYQPEVVVVDVPLNKPVMAAPPRRGTKPRLVAPVNEFVVFTYAVIPSELYEVVL